MIGRPPRNVKPSRFSGLVAGLLALPAASSPPGSPPAVWIGQRLKEAPRKDPR